ncbi:unnamed protein product [Allacma fusca]|uniref:UDP-glucuronosyltransferase n=1 Tax=Allacma fusca TaxID=39272 RepID=A0A8J2JVJ8_9HEXA|nr:unnamed protein product [Allacma fusca]
MNIKVYLLLSLCFLAVQKNVSGENILFYMGVSNYSHRISIWPLVEKLAELGHNVTFISAHPPKSLANPKVHEFIPKGLRECYLKFVGTNLIEMRKQFGPARSWDGIFEFFAEANRLMVQEEEFREWFRTSSYDFVFIDSLTSDLALGLAYKFNAPYALITTTAPYTMWQPDMVGSPAETSWIPDMQLSPPEEMTLWDKIWNTLNPIIWTLHRHYVFYPKAEKLLREDLGLKDMPDLRELEASVSLVLANTHYSDDYARSYPPLVVPVGGMQCFQKLKPASKEMEAFMNSTGPEGFIYVSFGSAAQITDMPPEQKNIFFTAMRTAKTNFFLKWSDDSPKDLPKNVFTSSWVPQQTILAHPNARGFITHGGLLGIQEAMFSGLPMIVAPVFGEQDYNAQKVHNTGRGIRIELNTLTQEELDNAISSILTDPSYKENMEEASRLFKDRPENPVDTAVWWTQYILRHGPVNALRPLGLKQTWYQRRLLDVWFTIFTALVFLPLLVLILFCKLCLKCRSKRGPENLLKKRN